MSNGRRRALFVLLRLLVVIALGSGLVGLALLPTRLAVVGRPLALGVLGFVCLAAFAAAEVLRQLQLPRLTGYLLVGIAVGPYAANLLSNDALGEMRVFSLLALGLVGTSAGLGLHLRALGQAWRALLATVGLTLLLVVPATAGVFYIMTARFGFAGLSDSSALVMSLLVGALCFGTSPSVSIAMLSEARAKGRLSDLVLGSAVLKDLILVSVFGFALGVVPQTVAPATSLASMRSGVETLSEIASIGVGLGGLLLLYIRFVRVQPALFLAALILLAGDLSRLRDFELLVAFVVAGCIVRNASKLEYELRQPLKTLSLPAFILFFALLAASLDLRLALAPLVLVLVLALSLVRALAFWVAAKAGGAAGAEAPLIQSSAGLGSLPLAATSLGLSSMAAVRLPELAAPLTSFVAPFVLINLLLGPIALRIALARCGEIGKATSPEQEPRWFGLSLLPRDKMPTEQERASTYDSALREGALLEADAALTSARARLSRGVLADEFDRLHQELTHRFEEFANKTLDPWASALQRSADRAVVEGSEKLSVLHVFAEQASNSELEQRASSLRHFFEQLQSALLESPELLEVALEASEQRIKLGDSLSTRWRKRRLGLFYLLSFGRMKRVRAVPLRGIARTALEPNVARLLDRVLKGWVRVEAAVIEELRHWAMGKQLAETTRESIGVHLVSWRERCTADSKSVVAQGLSQFAELAAQAGGPRLPASQVRYSRVEAEIATAIEAITETSRVWARGIVAAYETLAFGVHLALIDRTLQRVTDDIVLQPLAETCAVSLAKVESVHASVAALKLELNQEAAAPQAAALLANCRNAFPASIQMQLRRARVHFVRTAVARELVLELRALVDTLPRRRIVLSQEAAMHFCETPAPLLRAVNLRELAEQKLLVEFLTGVDSTLADVSTRIALLSNEVRQAVDVAVHALEPGPNGADRLATNLVIQGIERSSARIELVRQGLYDAMLRTCEQIRTRTASLRAEFELLALGQAATEMGSARVEPSLQRFLREFSEQVQPAWHKAKAAYTRMRARIRRLYASELSRDIQIRYARQALDARSIRAYLGDWRSDLRLPDDYRRLFTLEPLRDRRFFIANQTELAALLDSEGLWLTGGPSSALIVGRHGSGMTSVLNLCQVELQTRRVLRPDWMLSRRELGILPILSDELGCEPSVHQMVNALTAERTVVLIDELQSWFSPDAAGLGKLEQFLELVVQTKHQVFWIITVEQEALAMIEQAFSIREAFGQIVRLQPASSEALLQAIEARHRVTGFDVKYPRTFAGKFLHRWGSTSERSVFFRLLASGTEGNLRLSIMAWRRAVHIVDASHLSVSLPRLLSIGLPFVPLLPPRPASMLVQLLRFGPLDASGLAAGSGLTTGECARNEGFLQSAGLIEPIAGRSEFRIPVALQDGIARGLRQMGALSSGEAA